MQNTIPPLVGNSQPPSMTDTVIKGEISNITASLPSLKVGDNILLQMIMDDLGKYSLKIDPASTLSTLAGEGKTSNPNITLDKALNLPPNKETPITVRITGNNQSNIQFKVSSIDNLPVEKFVATNTGQISRNIPSTIEGSGQSTIKTINLPAQPLKTAPELIQKFEQAGFSKDAVSNIKTLTANIGLITDTKVKLPILTEQNLTNIIKSASPDKVIENLKSQVIKGEVISIPDKPLTIRTILGDFIIDKNIKLPQNTEVFLSLKDILLPQTNTKTKTIFDIIKPLSDLASCAKTASQSIKQAPKQVLPHNLHQIIVNKLPTTDNKMIINMINFIKAAQNKDLSMWLGKEGVQAISNHGTEGQEVVSKLSSIVNNALREPNISWRIIEVPFFSGEVFSSIRVSIKENFDEQGTSGKNRKNGTRFLVDTNFSQLGEFQFDGFAVEKDRRFDLIIRTSKQIEDDIFSHIYRIFKTTLHDFEYSGNLKVNVKENFIKICEDNQNNTLNKGIFI